MTDKGKLIAGRYRLISQLGTGAMGVVWQAHDERLHRTVAVKQLLLQSGVDKSEAEEANRRAMREGRIAARLHHPHAITVYDVAQHEDKPCLIMEYLRSESLSTVLATRGALPPDEVARIGSQIASALAAAHEVGIVHRDIKPGNVLLAEDGTAKITDFGISRAVGDVTLTATGIVAGTPAYLAPEAAQGQNAGFPADVFSLGSTLYAAVEGMPPFGLDDNALAMLYRIATGEITPPRQSGRLAPVLARILERDLSQRPTMQQAQKALAEVASSRPQPLDAPPSTAPPPAADSSAQTGDPVPGPPTEDATQRSRRPAAAITVVAVSLVVAAIILMTALLDDESPSASPAPSPSTPSLSAPSPSTAPGSAPSPQATPPAPAPNPAAEPAPNPATSTPTSDASPQDVPEQLQAAVSDYYALMPGNLQEGFTRLTADYQRNHAGGFTGYQAFWDPVARVEISNVSATPPATVNATITYFYRDGRVIEEQTSFGLVNQDGQWKIARSNVGSSRTTQG